MHGLLELSLQVLNAFSPAKYGTYFRSECVNAYVARDVLIYLHSELIADHREGNYDGQRPINAEQECIKRKFTITIRQS
jgi:hypothetical protein